MSLSGSLSFTGTQPSSPPSVNPGSLVSAVAAVADSGGAVEVIEWDADGNGTFERREYTVPIVSGGDVLHAPLTIGELTQSVNTSTPGLKTVVARITDNGALDAADNIRRQLTFTAQVRVNAVPTASNVNASTSEDTPTTITMIGSDADNQPAALTYEIVSPPATESGTLGSVTGNQVTFTPAAGFSGSTSFTYRVRDGGPGTVAAWAFSNAATVSITVSPTNDSPSVDPKSGITNEDTAVDIQATGSDPEGGALAWSIASQPANGSASCNATSGVCSYTPSANFFGSDSFVVRGTDTGGAAATATFSMTVNPLNDAPIANDQSVTLGEDGSLPIVLTASDVDGDSLTFQVTTPPAHGTLAGVAPDVVYTPAEDYHGPDQFAFAVGDGNGGQDMGLVEVTVVPVNDPPIATGGSINTPENTSVAFQLSGTDRDGDPLTFTAAPVADGSLSCTPAGSCDFTPAAGFIGEVVVGYQVSDGEASDAGVFIVTVQEAFQFSGFKSPVDNRPTVNRMKAGAAVPIKFSLGGDQGLNIFAAEYPRSHVMECGSSGDVDAIEQTVSAGSSSLTYDAATDTYIYVWKTDANWKNTCRQLVILFRNGATARADFEFFR